MIPAFFRKLRCGLRRWFLPVTLEISETLVNGNTNVTVFEGIVPGDEISLTDTKGGRDWITIKVS